MKYRSQGKLWMSSICSEVAHFSNWKSNESWKQYVEVWTHICGSVNTLFLEKCNAISPKAIQIPSLLSSSGKSQGQVWKRGDGGSALHAFSFIVWTSHSSTTPRYFHSPTEIWTGIFSLSGKSLILYASDSLELLPLLPLMFQLFRFEWNARPRRIFCWLKHDYIPSECFLVLNIS